MAIIEDIFDAPTINRKYGHSDLIHALLKLQKKWRLNCMFIKLELIKQLKNLGLQAGQIIFLHASMRAVGKILGGPDELMGGLMTMNFKMVTASGVNSHEY